MSSKNINYESRCHEADSIGYEDEGHNGIANMVVPDNCQNLYIKHSKGGVLFHVGDQSTRRSIVEASREV